MEICIAASKNTFDARYLHFHVVCPWCPWCMKALHLHMYDIRVCAILCLQSIPNLKVSRVLSDRWSTYNSRPMAGPFGSTSDTTTVVSPVSGCGLSLPPDMAKPNPSLESCHCERKKYEKQAFRRMENDSKWHEWRERMQESKRAEYGHMLQMQSRDRGRRSTFQQHSQTGQWRAAGRVAVNSIWSLVLWYWEVWSSALLNPRKTFDNNLGNNTETSSVPYIQAPLSLLCLCSQRAQTKLHWGTKDQVVCTSDLLNFLQILCIYF